MLFHFSLFLKFWVSYGDSRKPYKVEVGNLKLLFLLRADPYIIDNATDCYSFWNRQKYELCVL